MLLRRKPLAKDASVRLRTSSLHDNVPATALDQHFQDGGSKFGRTTTDEQFIVDQTMNLDISTPQKDVDVKAADWKPMRHIQDLKNMERFTTDQDLYDRTTSDGPLTLSSETSHPLVTQTGTAMPTSNSPTMTSSSEIDIPTIALQSSRSGKKPKVASVLQDASLFLGGLIKHPTESTKHFSILRHSHGLVYYKGPMTSIAITVFADQPLPSSRRYWLQMKGWTGHAGMRAKAFMRTNGNWIQVTPTIRATASEPPSMDERAWQRDIQNFSSKAPQSLQQQTVRETAVLRVPFEAVDGYFRIVLTGADSRHPLCPSPVFRVASTSMSAGSIRGASLSTLPLELSVSVLQYAATTMASNFVAPFAETARSQIASALPSTISSYGQIAYNFSGAQDQVADLNRDYDDRRDVITEQSREGTKGKYCPLSRQDLVGGHSGPNPPFPIRFDSEVVKGSGIGRREVGMPTANLSSAPADTVATLNGVYFGWAFVTPKDMTQGHLHRDWRQAIITITYDHATTSVAAKKVIRAHLLHDYEGQEFYDAKISLVILGYLRPAIEYKRREAFFCETMRDVDITQMCLGREQWGPMPSLQRIRTANSERSFSERYVDSRMALQRRLDTVPVHRLGIKSHSFGLRDRGLYGNGGLYVVRDNS